MRLKSGKNYFSTYFYLNLFFSFFVVLTYTFAQYYYYDDFLTDKIMDDCWESCIITGPGQVIVPEIPYIYHTPGELTFHDNLWGPAYLIYRFPLGEINELIVGGDVTVFGDLLNLSFSKDGFNWDLPRMIFGYLSVNIPPSMCESTHIYIQFAVAGCFNYMNEIYISLNFPELDGIATPLSNTKVKCSWPAGLESGDIGFNLYRTLNPSTNWTKVNDLPINESIIDPETGWVLYTDTDLSPNTTYYYFVKIEKSTGEEYWTTIFEGKTYEATIVNIWSLFQ